MDSLRAATDLEQLKDLAVVTNTEKQEIETLKTEIDALRTMNPAAQLKLAETGKQHLEALKKAFSTIGSRLGKITTAEYLKPLILKQRSGQTTAILPWPLGDVSLRGLTPYEYICSIWTKEPQRFKLDPTHLSPGLNT